MLLRVRQMTSDEIKRHRDDALQQAAAGAVEAIRVLPQWEIAFQLAILNESRLPERCALTQEEKDLKDYESQVAKGWIEPSLDVHEKLSAARRTNPGCGRARSRHQSPPRPGILRRAAETGSQNILEVAEFLTQSRFSSSLEKAFRLYRKQSSTIHDGPCISFNLIDIHSPGIHRRPIGSLDTGLDRRHDGSLDCRLWKRDECGRWGRRIRATSIRLRIYPHVPKRTSRESILFKMRRGRIQSHPRYPRAFEA